MRLLIISGALAAVALVVGCSGGGSATPPTANPITNPTSTPTTSPTGTPITSPATFTGGSQTVAFTASGGTFTVSPADNTYSGSIAWGANNASTGFNFTMSWATYAQITGTFSPGALPSSIGTALLYFDFNSASTVSFTQTPAVTVSTTGSFPGSACGWATYSATGGSGTKAWTSMTGFGIAEVAPSGGSFSVAATTLPAPNTVDFTAAQDQYIAIYCH